MGKKTKKAEPESKPPAEPSGFAPCMVAKDELYEKFPHLKPVKKKKK